METQKLLKEIIEYLKNKYSATGFSAADQADGCMSSKVVFSVDCKGGIKEFVLALTNVKS